MIDVVRESNAACHERLAQLFPAGALIWIEAEEYNERGMHWKVTLLRQTASGQWERCRYQYDIPSAALFFMGCSPVTDAEAARIRQRAVRLRSGHVFNSRTS